VKTILDWAISVRPDLVALQRETGIPALFAAAQFCHESYDARTGGLTELATKHHNYAGIKWVGGWQDDFGARPVMYGTWEVIDGRRQDMGAAFASFPDWPTWLRAYAHLLGFDRYRGAKVYAGDPLLYAYHVWTGGWATDPNYLLGIARWMVTLWPHYADTLDAPHPGHRQEVPIRDAGGRLLATGWLEDGSTVVKVRELAEAMGLQVEWHQEERAVTLRWPGRA